MITLKKYTVRIQNHKYIWKDYTDWNIAEILNEWSRILILLSTKIALITTTKNIYDDQTVLLE